MTQLAGLVAGLASAVVAGAAHIGSPDAWYEGPAGPYRVLVHVEAPGVVPGIAIVNVHTLSDGVERVTAFVNKYDATGGTPPPDVATPVPDNPGWYRTRLWVMTAGSQGVTVAIHGGQGVGSVVVPLTATAGRRLDFDGRLAGLLVAVGVFLALGLFTIVGAAVRESVLPPGSAPDSDRRRRARRAMARAVVVVTLVITAMAAWWRSADADFARALFRPLATATQLERDSLGSRLTLSISDSAWIHRSDIGWLRAHGRTQFTGLVEDHGALIHLFLVAEDTTAFAHLHPSTSDTVSFTASLPPLPAGKYRVFADIVHASGFSQTLTSTVTLPADAAASRKSLDSPNDSWAVGRRDPYAGSATLDDSSSLTWLRESAPLVAKMEAGLRFALAAPPGDTAGIEPYLGMAGHAVVVREDGNVFIHLHPLGNISLAAQNLLTRTAPEHRPTHARAPRDTLHFPYAFPSPGKYTVWVQLKRRGRVLTTSFATDVAPEASK